MIGIIFAQYRRLARPPAVVAALGCWRCTYHAAPPTLQSPPPLHRRPGTVLCDIEVGIDGVRYADGRIKRYITVDGDPDVRPTRVTPDNSQPR